MESGRWFVGVDEGKNFAGFEGVKGNFGTATN